MITWYDTMKYDNSMKESVESHTEYERRQDEYEV